MFVGGLPGKYWREPETLPLGHILVLFQVDVPHCGVSLLHGPNTEGQKDWTFLIGSFLLEGSTFLLSLFSVWRDSRNSPNSFSPLKGTPTSLVRDAESPSHCLNQKLCLAATLLTMALAQKLHNIKGSVSSKRSYQSDFSG